MKRVSFLCALAAAAAFMVPSAKADTFNISFNSLGLVGYSGSGVFTGTENAGVYTIDGVLSGSVTDTFFGTSSIVGISSYEGADNLLTFPSTTYFDFNGLSFTLANGININLFYDGSSEGALQSSLSGDIPEPVTDTVTAVAPTPEPGSFVLLGTAGLLGLGVYFQRRRSIA